MQNGGEFGYLVMFRPVGSTSWTTERVPAVESSRFVYRNASITPLSPFEVKVGVYNSEGEGPLSTVCIVYSGEDGECVCGLWAAPPAGRPHAPVCHAPCRPQAPFCIPCP